MSLLCFANTDLNGSLNFCPKYLSDLNFLTQICDPLDLRTTANIENLPIKKFKRKKKEKYWIALFLIQCLFEFESSNSDRPVSNVFN